jgi:hypothetical protein
VSDRPQDDPPGLRDIAPRLDAATHMKRPDPSFGDFLRRRSEERALARLAICGNSPDGREGDA